MGLRPTKGDESRSVVRPVADAPGSGDGTRARNPERERGARRGITFTGAVNTATNHAR